MNWKLFVVERFTRTEYEDGVRLTRRHNIQQCLRWGDYICAKISIDGDRATCKLELGTSF